MSEFVKHLYKFQRDKKIIERDHYYSIQCFLLAIVLIKKFYPSNLPKLPKDIVTILYSMTMYHDVGYLYKSINISENKIDENFADIFSCRTISNSSDTEEILCLETELYQSEESINDIINRIKNSKEIENIWKPGSLQCQVLLENDTGLPSSSLEYKKSHAYKSALILYKIFYTKNIIRCPHYEWMSKEGINDDKIKWFKQILKATFHHGMKSFSPLLNTMNDFYSVFLMIIDELQTYGRISPHNKNSDIINPKDVGFHWDKTNPSKLVIDIITKNPELIKKCKAHNSKGIKAILNKKIDKSSLSLLL